jgi:hypothetical protein
MADFAKIETVLFPNPAIDQFIIESSVKMKSVGIYNLSGMNIINENVSGNIAAVNIFGLNKGLYLVKIISENGITYEKLMVE